MQFIYIKPSHNPLKKKEKWQINTKAQNYLNMSKNLCHNCMNMRKKERD